MADASIRIALAVTAVLMAFAALALVLWGAHIGAAFALVALWGLAFGMAPVVLPTNLSRARGCFGGGGQPDGRLFSGGHQYRRGSWRLYRRPPRRCGTIDAYRSPGGVDGCLGAAAAPRLIVGSSSRIEECAVPVGISKRQQMRPPTIVGDLTSVCKSPLRGDGTPFVLRSAARSAVRT